MRGGGGILCLLCACVALSSPLPLLIGLGLILLQALISLVPCFGASWYWQWRYHSENALLCCGAPPRSEEWFCLPTDVISIAASLGLQRDARVLVVGNGSSRVAELLAATCDAAWCTLWIYRRRRSIRRACTALVTSPILCGA